ncbi:hypothetical protein EHS25_003722 [Saitozyma podzolica]|uniref:Uncharacterized protein n=1 Tax=Saitozyma podzolica TaxID=1890683 RepID=A0A427Y3E7_9TREE|nr:hypothetical protein EHS25_003722 [Saitozyma podzolica]
MSFHARQLTLRALLFSALLILGYVLLTTTASAPLPVLTSPTLPSCIKSLSSLIFLTLLWLCFTVLELADSDLHPRVGEADSNSDSDSDAWDAPTPQGQASLCFSQLRVEMGLNAALALAWAAQVRGLGVLWAGHRRIGSSSRQPLSSRALSSRPPSHPLEPLSFRHTQYRSTSDTSLQPAAFGVADGMSRRVLGRVVSSLTRTLSAYFPDATAILVAYNTDLAPQLGE